jgi:transcriptional regulator with XRE-family HTH domain
MYDETRDGAAAPGFTLISLIAERVQRERERAGMSLTELAKRAGISKSTLSQLESGTGNPSMETLWGLSVALGVPFSRLVDPPRAQVQVIRAGTEITARSEQSDYAVTLLTASAPHARRDLYRIVAQPGESCLSQPHAPGTCEHLVLSTGRALAGPADEPVELGPGDYVNYPGDVPHVFRALAADTTAVIVMEQV